MDWQEIWQEKVIKFELSYAPVYEQTNMNKYENIIDLHAPVKSGEFLPMARS